MSSCDVCHKVFKKNRLLRLHFRRQHVDKSEWTDKCEICGKVYADEEILARHSATHDKKDVEQPCPVSSCKKSFQRKCYLDKHVAHNHPEIMTSDVKQNVQKSFKKKEYCCVEPGCVASFAKHHLLTQHSYFHTKVPPFSCQHCEKNFLTLSSKKRHQKVHDGYPCEECGFVAANWSAYLTHAHRHKKAGPNEFPCRECSKVFASKSRLNQHMLVHAEVRPVFRCTQCTRTFTKKFALLKHISVVHEGEKPFKCQLPNCGKSYAYCHSLKKHFDTFHNPNKTESKRSYTKKSTVERILGLDIKKIKVATAPAEA